ncbi:SAM-dependent methyltransferase [Streptomyces sp. NPDC002589]|uniref:SAM-dependent methyltransferase n=1 Tax=Streptomyces sp. NPDC002589 TaxID=3154420 RepID=UPI00332EC07F
MNLPVPVVSAARIHTALLGGAVFAVDRSVAIQLTNAVPWWPRAARTLHEQGLRMAAHLVARGFDQVLDLGCGLPSPSGPLVHEIAAARYPGATGARTVYVDRDIHAHAARRIGLVCQPGSDGSDAVLADITATEDLLEHPAVQGLNWRRPIAVLLHDVLPWLSDDAATHLMAVLRHRLAPGSIISSTHLLSAPHPYATAPLVQHHRKAGIGLWPRHLPAITALTGTWPTYIHSGPGRLPVCTLLTRSPGPGRFARPAFWPFPAARGREHRPLRQPCAMHQPRQTTPRPLPTAKDTQ